MSRLFGEQLILFSINNMVWKYAEIKNGYSNQMCVLFF